MALNEVKLTLELKELVHLRDEICGQQRVLKGRSPLNRVDRLELLVFVDMLEKLLDLDICASKF